MKALETKQLIKSFGGVHAVDHLSISIEKGTITGIIGPNGSGKSTLVNTLTGVHPIDGGEVMMNGAAFKRIDAADMPAYGVTRTFQDVRLFEQMTVLDNILVVLTERNVWGALFERHSSLHLKKAQDALTTVGLWEKRGALAANLSYGQRKLLEVARAVAIGAELYFFDEPFAGMFPEMIKVVVRVMEDLRTKGKTIMLIEHNMELIRTLCDRVIVMDTGELLAEGAPDSVLARRDVIEAYLGE
jgi:branched-chain amino acid transport system ATP-binding protein